MEIEGGTIAFNGPNATMRGFGNRYGIKDPNPSVFGQTDTSGQALRHLHLQGHNRISRIANPL
jgi:hypothetical protein